MSSQCLLCISTYKIMSIAVFNWLINYMHTYVSVPLFPQIYIENETEFHGGP